MGHGESLVLGAVLRVDLCGWRGPAPRLPEDPVRILEDSDGLRRCFIYDLLPKRSCIGVADACQRLGALIGALSEDWPFRDLPFPALCHLDLGLVPAGEARCWRSHWPVAFLSVLAEADIELGVTHYAASEDSGATSD